MQNFAWLLHIDCLVDDSQQEFWSSSKNFAAVIFTILCFHFGPVLAQSMVALWVCDVDFAQLSFVCGNKVTWWLQQSCILVAKCWFLAWLTPLFLSCQKVVATIVLDCVTMMMPTTDSSHSTLFRRKDEPEPFVALGKISNLHMIEFLLQVENDEMDLEKKGKERWFVDDPFCTVRQSLNDLSQFHFPIFWWWLITVWRWIKAPFIVLQQPCVGGCLFPLHLSWPRAPVLKIIPRVASVIRNRNCQPRRSFFWERPFRWKSILLEKMSVFVYSGGEIFLKLSTQMIIFQVSSAGVRIRVWPKTFWAKQTKSLLFLHRRGVFRSRVVLHAHKIHWTHWIQRQCISCIISKHKKLDPIPTCYPPTWYFNIQPAVWLVTSWLARWVRLERKVPLSCEAFPRRSLPRPNHQHSRCKFLLKFPNSVLLLLPWPIRFSFNWRGLMPTLMDGTLSSCFVQFLRSVVRTICQTQLY